MSIGDLFEADLIIAPCIEMSTTIVRIYTAEGFVIAADGRNYSLETKAIVSDSVPKIFGVEEQGRCLVYSLSGTAELTPKGSTEVLVDIIAAIHTVVNNASQNRFKSLWHYVQGLSEQLARLVDDAKWAVIGNEPATFVFFDGYYDGRPKRAHLKLFYDGQVPEVSTEELLPGHPVGVGSNEILRVLSDKHGPLAKYRTPSFDVNPTDRTLLDAIAITRSWTQAHCSREAVDIDPRCVSMGGDVLMCKLTSQSGQQWIPYA